MRFEASLARRIQIKMSLLWILLFDRRDFELGQDELGELWLSRLLSRSLLRDFIPSFSIEGLHLVVRMLHLVLGILWMRLLFRRFGQEDISRVTWEIVVEISIRWRTAVGKWIEIEFLGRSNSVCWANWIEVVVFGGVSSLWAYVIRSIGLDCVHDEAEELSVGDDFVGA